MESYSHVLEKLDKTIKEALLKLSMPEFDA